eukprot:3976318-Prymnesium_polylepis.1
MPRYMSSRVCASATPSGPAKSWSTVSTSSHVARISLRAACARCASFAAARRERVPPPPCTHTHTHAVLRNNPLLWFTTQEEEEEESSSSSSSLHRGGCRTFCMLMFKSHTTIQNPNHALIKTPLKGTEGRECVHSPGLCSQSALALLCAGAAVGAATGESRGRAISGHANSSSAMGRPTARLHSPSGGTTPNGSSANARPRKHAPSA